MPLVLIARGCPIIGCKTICWSVPDIYQHLNEAHHDEEHPGLVVQCIGDHHVTWHEHGDNPPDYCQCGKYTLDELHRM